MMNTGSDQENKGAKPDTSVTRPATPPQEPGAVSPSKKNDHS
jgi:hypothetical protein